MCVRACVRVWICMCVYALWMISRGMILHFTDSSIVIILIKWWLPGCPTSLLIPALRLARLGHFGPPASVHQSALLGHSGPPGSVHQLALLRHPLKLLPRTLLVAINLNVKHPRFSCISCSLPSLWTLSVVPLNINDGSTHSRICTYVNNWHSHQFQTCFHLNWAKWASNSSLNWRPSSANILSKGCPMV